MNFQDYSLTSRKRIEEYLRAFFLEKRSESIPESFKKQRALEELEKFVLRGKLIRGTLFLLTVEYFGEQLTDRHIAIASAIELVHSALLIQDDIIDNDAMRRGDKTLYAAYQRIGEEISATSPYHYGISIAIVISDIAFFLAYELLSSFNESSLSNLIKFYSHEIYLVALAEGIDSEFGQTNNEPSEDDIYAVYHYKTARYTFSMPFIMAGIVCNAPQEQTGILEKIGELAGIIFQLKDDVIGIFGNEEVIGKPVGSDIRENKKTIIRHLLYKMCNEHERKVLDRSFGNSEMTGEELSTVVDIAKKYSIEKLIEEKITNIANEQQEYLKNLLDNSYKKILTDLLEFNLKRTY